MWKKTANVALPKGVLYLVIFNNPNEYDTSANNDPSLEYKYPYQFDFGIANGTAPAYQSMKGKEKAPPAYTSVSVQVL